MRPTDSARAIEAIEPLTLFDLDAVAALQTRFDRKYIVASERLDELLDAVAESARVLEIAGRRNFGYESTYFDTPAFDSYLRSARRRPDRFKVRTRSYTDSGVCAVEVKLRDRHGKTVKYRTTHDFADRDRITCSAHDFLDQFAPLAPFRDALGPTLTTRYRRSTLLVGQSRVTVDLDLTCVSAAAITDDRIAMLPGVVVVETKTAGVASEVDRLLWAMHIRPAMLSKYGTALAALRPDLPANKWHRTLERHVRVRAASHPSIMTERDAR